MKLDKEATEKVGIKVLRKEKIEKSAEKRSKKEDRKHSFEREEESLNLRDED